MRTRLAPLPRELPDAVTARRRARAGTGLLAGLLLFPFAVGGLADARSLGVALGLVTGQIGFLLLSELCAERPPSRCSATRLTARTLTGMRSVDLNRVTGVRLLTAFSYGSVHRTLLVRDAHGVWLGITSPAGRRALSKALERQAADRARPIPWVSRAARAHLDGDRAGQLAVHTVLVFLAQVGALCTYVVAVLKAGGCG